MSVAYIVHGTLQATILEWIAFPFSRRSSQPRDLTQVSCMTSGFFTCWAARDTHAFENGRQKRFPPVQDFWSSTGFLNLESKLEFLISMNRDEKSSNKFEIGFKKVSAWRRNSGDQIFLCCSQKLQNICFLPVASLPEEYQGTWARSLVGELASYYTKWPKKKKETKLWAFGVGALTPRP